MEKLGQPNLARTAAAIDAYDNYCKKYMGGDCYVGKTNDECSLVMTMEDELGEAVGIAFGLDTSDRNNPATCKQCVRPGSKNPPPGFQESWLRKAVADWREANGAPKA